MESTVDAICLIFVNLNRAEVLKKGFRPFFLSHFICFFAFFLTIFVSLIDGGVRQRCRAKGFQLGMSRRGLAPPLFFLSFTN